MAHSVRLEKWAIRPTPKSFELFGTRLTDSEKVRSRMRMEPLALLRRCLFQFEFHTAPISADSLKHGSLVDEDKNTIVLVGPADAVLWRSHLRFT